MTSGSDNGGRNNLVKKTAKMGVGTVNGDEQRRTVLTFLADDDTADDHLKTRLQNS